MNPILPKLPAGISEDDLIDLADGRLSREREGEVLSALKADPALGAMVKGMREDCVAMASLGRVRAPAGLAEGIEARLESAALRDLAMASNATSDAIPISTVDVRGPGIVELLMESVWPRRLAMAASVAIVAGLGVWGVRSAMKPSKPTPGPAIVTNTKSASDAPAEDMRPVAPVAIAPPTDLAVIDPDAMTIFAPEPLIAAEPSTKAVAMTEARAAELARDGRLTVTIHTTTAQGAIRRLDALAKAGGREGWKSLPLEAMPAEYAMLLTPSWSGPHAPANLPGPTTVASSTPGSSRPIGAAPAAPVGPFVRGIYTVDVNPGEKGMNALVRAITDLLPEGAVVELRETARRADAPLMLDAESVLWWNAAPGKWAKRTTVPIVVESLE